MFSLTAFTRYIEELQSYKDLLQHVEAAMIHVIFWRGHYRVRALGKEVLLPLHSMIAFTWGILVTWNINLFPSFLLFSIGWIMLASNEHARRAKSRWDKVRSYTSYLRLLLFNETYQQIIMPNENLEAINASYKAEEERKKKLIESKKAELEHEKQVQALAGYDQIGDTKEEDIETKRDLSVNPVLIALKPVLFPIQIKLRELVYKLRVAKYVFNWRESYYAFWITTLSFVASIAVMWVPWCWLLLWGSRAAVFLILGPWMALIDKWYIHPNLSDDERKELIHRRSLEKYKEMKMAVTDYHIHKEKNMKLKSMRNYLFGKYLLRVPHFNNTFHPDSPLAQSSAKPFDPTSWNGANIVDRA